MMKRKLSSVELLKLRETLNTAYKDEVTKAREMKKANQARLFKCNNEKNFNPDYPVKSSRPASSGSDVPDVLQRDVRRANPCH